MNGRNTVMKLRRKIAVVMVVVFALTACDLPIPDFSAPNGPGVTATADLGAPDGTAQAFLSAWTSKDYAGMYSLITPLSQKEHTLDDFTNTYASAETTMTLKGLTATLTSVLNPNGTSAQAS